MQEEFGSLIRRPETLTPVEADELRAQAGWSAAVFCNEFSRYLAQQYHDRIVSFETADRLVNTLWTLAAHHWNEIPDYFLEVFLAFESGEFGGPEDPPGSDPESLHTRPRIAEILASSASGPRA